VETSYIHSTGSKSLAAFIDHTALKEHDSKRHLKFEKYFQGHNANGDLSCIAKDTCMVEWNVQNTCDLKLTTPICPLTTRECSLIASDNYTFHINSGTTSHFSPKNSDFVELYAIPILHVGGINGTSLAAIGRGKIVIICGKGWKLTLKDALYVPQVTLHLISVGRLTNEGILSTFSLNECTLYHGTKVMANGRCTGKGLYLMNA